MTRRRASSHLGVKLFLGGNERGVSTLAFLDEATKHDIVVMELDSWQLKSFGDAHISPHIAVFTNLLSDHMNYYKGDMEWYFDDKAQIFMHQNEDDYLVMSEQILDKIVASYPEHTGKHIVGRASDVPDEWALTLPGEHNKVNIACAMHVAHVLGISDDIVREVAETFAGVEGRLELVREVKGVKYYNDTTATMPDATIAALESIGDERNVVLVMGGNEKNVDASKLVEVLPEHCKAIVLLPGTGTDKLPVENLKSQVETVVGVKSMEEAVGEAQKLAQKGDVVLMSPAFTSFGLFKNEYDRGDQFKEFVSSL